LVRFHGLGFSGRAHRAMADALVTAQLLLKVRDEVARRFAMDLGDGDVDHALLAHLQRTPVKTLRRGLVEHLKARQAA
ncbi:hypothetical protein ACXWOG_11275, partial [Streptococcus pyogenes]